MTQHIIIALAHSGGDRGQVTMFERYTDRARRSVILAQEHAMRMTHWDIDVEHLLYGLAAEGDGVAARALRDLGVEAADIVRVIDAVHPQGQSVPPANLPFTRDLKKALEMALREAITLGHNYIGTEHLLLGVTAFSHENLSSACAQVLKNLEVAPDVILGKVTELLAGYEQPRPEPGTATLEAVLSEVRNLNSRVEALSRHLGVGSS